MGVDNDEVVDYLIGLGYKYTEKKRLLANPSTFTKNEIKIEFDTFFQSTFRIYKGGEEVFDIDKVSRRVFPIKTDSNEHIKSVGIPHPISLSEVKEALRTLNIDNLLDE